MEDILKDLIPRLEEIVAGLPLEFKDIPAENVKTVCTMALHCVLNGPVGVGKDTVFPLVGRGIIKTKVPKVSNKGWKLFCKSVAEYLVAQNVKVHCGAVRRLNTYWPLKEW
jgi:hypothetical protein